MAISTIEQQTAHVWEAICGTEVLCYRHVRNKAALEDITDHIRDAKTLFSGLMMRLGYHIGYHGEVSKTEEEVA